MKKLLLIAALAAIASADCGIKIAKLERKLDIARSYGNIGQINGLERALANVRAYCGNGAYRGAAYGADLSREFGWQNPLKDGFNQRNDFNTFNPDGFNPDREIRSQIDALEDAYERQEDAIEDQLDALNDRKDSMSKSEYKRQKAALKARKKQLKADYKRQKRELKHRMY